ncbi:hypothetical protein B0J18DRAFT_451844 [Chaetomium sp. MPI-SDFR-AT-0129]|nr:hypothetical protein B0J18DRAFT_451844 [Chaetomium sp. MPI-SDFR-AT-0129]
MFCEMEPPIGVSVARTSASQWILGSQMVCEKVHNPEPKPADAIASWQDGDATFYLRKSSKNELSGAGDVESDRIYAAGTSSAVWCLGENAFCKVHAWCEGLELEANTLGFVREKAPEIPIPEVVHSWIDHDLSRTFLVTKRLSATRRIQIADEIARFCATLAGNTSSQFETITGRGVYEPWLMEVAPDSHPTWKPRTLGPLSQEAMHTYMTKISTDPPPNINPLFHFYHADLGPTNVMVSEDGSGRVTGIIDWELAAYFPRFWMATKPGVTAAFHFECETEEPKLWGELLGKALERHGYERVDGVFRRWSNAMR